MESEDSLHDTSRLYHKELSFLVKNYLKLPFGLVTVPVLHPLHFDLPGFLPHDDSL